jgi:Protein of unknown function (DUF2844).
MKRIPISFVLCVCMAIATLIKPGLAQAALGEPIDSVATDRVALKAVQSAAAVSSSYSVQELKSNLISVREYLTSSGVVFAIAWKGLTHPDLTPLLGSFAKEYTEGRQNAPHQRGRRRSQLKTEHLVVEKWGHMRNLQGRAYLKALIPPGVKIDEIN